MLHKRSRLAGKQLEYLLPSSKRLKTNKFRDIGRPFMRKNRNNLIKDLSRPRRLFWFKVEWATMAWRGWCIAFDDLNHLYFVAIISHKSRSYLIRWDQLIDIKPWKFPQLTLCVFSQSLRAEMLNWDPAGVFGAEQWGVLYTDPHWHQTHDTATIQSHGLLISLSGQGTVDVCVHTPITQRCLNPPPLRWRTEELSCFILFSYGWKNHGMFGDPIDWGWCNHSKCG